MKKLFSRVLIKVELIEISDAGIENIMDVNYQRELMKEWLKFSNEIRVQFPTPKGGE